MWTWFKDIIFAWISFTQGLVGDWGLAIIIITVIIRIILTPLTARQYKSTYEMQKIQPKITELQKRYADDKQRLNEETMKIYADKKYNPLAGCLPIIIQMPIFIALYRVLYERIPAGACFYGVVPDLTASPSSVWSFSYEGFMAALPYIILVILFAVSILIPMLMQPNQNSSTKFMAIIMTLMMIWFGWIAPSGVLLYWVASAYIGLGQQFVIRRMLKRRDKAEEEAVIEITPVQVDVERREHKARPRKKK